MASKRLNLTRDQLATFLKNHEQIKQFEQLFDVADRSLEPSDAVDLLSLGPGVESNNSNSLVADYIDLSESAPFFNKSGRLAWDSTENTIKIGHEDGVVQQVGQETYMRVINKTGATITKGEAVGFSGVDSNRIEIEPFIADGSMKNIDFLGVMPEGLNNNDVGFVTLYGVIGGLNTDTGVPVGETWVAGDRLWSNQYSAGELTNIKPTATDNVVFVGIVLSVSVSNGQIMVNPFRPEDKAYGEFSNTTGAIAAAINTPYQLDWDNVILSKSVAISGTYSSRIYVYEKGLYQFDLRLHIESIASVATTMSMWVWYRLNGSSDYANSSVVGSIEITSGYVILTNNQLFSLNALDYVEVMFAVDNTDLVAASVAATAFAPAAPCALINVTQFQQ